MTGEFHIEILKQYKEKPTLINEISSVEEAVWLDEALDAAIKALEQQQSRDMEEIKEIMGCDTDAETKCKMISNILTAKPHYFEKQESKYCDRNICIKNEYNGIGCDECEVTKSKRQWQESEE